MTISGFGYRSAATFGGDFGSLFTGVLHYLRSDLGITQSGGNITGWAAQVGPNVVTADSGCTYIGTVGTGLNGHASIIGDGANHAGKYTLALPALLTGPTFFWVVWRMISAPTVPSCIFADQNIWMRALVNQSTTNHYIGSSGASLGPVTTPTNTWGRGEYAFTPTASSYLKFGSGAPVSGDIATSSAPNSLRGIFGTNLGSFKINAELLCFITLDNVPSAPTLATASAAVTSFYGATVQI